MLVILNDTFANASKMPLIKLINYIIIGFYRSLINYEPKQKLIAMCLIKHGILLPCPKRLLLWELFTRMSHHFECQNATIGFLILLKLKQTILQCLVYDSQ